MFATLIVSKQCSGELICTPTQGPSIVTQLSLPQKVSFQVQVLYSVGDI